MNQLCPIGWGSFFAQLIQSGKVPVYRLTHNMRIEILPGIPNGIAINSERIVKCIENPALPFGFVQTSNFTVTQGDVERVFDVLKQLYGEGVNANDVTVVTPYTRSLDEINATAQSIFTGDATSVLDKRGKLWALKDRVLMMENNYGINVMNGEQGSIVLVDEKEVHVKFDEITHVFQLEKTKKPAVPKGKAKEEDEEEKTKDKELTVESLALAYCLTTHRCVSEDTFIYVENGLFRIKDLHQGNNRIHPVNFDVHGRYGPKNCMQVYKGNVEASIKITTEHGFELEGSHRHPVLVCGEDGVESWKRMPELRKGDTVVLRKGMQAGALNYVSTNSYVEPSDCRVDCLIPSYINEDIAYLLGVIVADGNYSDTEHYAVSIFEGTNDTENLHEDMRILRENFGIETKIVPLKDEECSKITVSRKKFRSFLEWCGLNYVTAHNKVVPTVILESPISCQKAYLSGIFDTDGGFSGRTIEISTVSDIHSLQIQLLLLNCGVISERRFKSTRKDNIWVIYIHGPQLDVFRDQVGFRNKRRTNLLSNYIANREHTKQANHVVPNSQQLISEFREEVKVFEGTSRYQGHSQQMVRMIGRIAAGHYTLHEYQIGLLLNEHPNAQLLGPRGRQIADYHQNGIFFEKIKEIEHKTCQMYDLSMNDESHSFVSNGLISHNSQGSEWPFVIVYIPATISNGSFLNRNLIYTAITRAKKAVYLVTPDLPTVNAAAVRPAPYRCDNLAARVNKYQNEIENTTNPPANTNPLVPKSSTLEPLLISKKLMAEIDELGVD